MKIEHSLTIRRPLDVVFGFVTDLRNETRWQPEIESVTLEGPMRAGSTFHERRVTLGRRYDWHFRITRLEPPHLITIETISGTAPYRGSRTFERVPGGTRVTESGELTLPWGLAVLDPLWRGLSRRSLRIAYDRLAALLEGDQRVTAPMRQSP